LRRSGCKGPLRRAASLKTRLWRIEADQPDLPRLALNHDGVAVHNPDCFRLDRLSGRSHGKARKDESKG